MPTEESSICHFIRNEMVAYNTPGLALAITDRDGCILADAYGSSNKDQVIPMESHSRFLIGSISKTFTAVALLKAAERGLIDLNAPVNSYIPWFSVNDPEHVITPHHLLSHTSGLPQGRDDLPPSRYMAASVRDFTPSYCPGEYYSDSNVDYQILGFLLEKMYDHPYGEIIKEEIILPLEMTDTEPAITNDARLTITQGYQHLHDDRPAHVSHPLVPSMWFEYAAADGSIVSTAPDLCIFLRMLMNGGHAGRKAILSDESFAKMTTRIAERSKDSWFGYGSYVRLLGGNTIVGHGGNMPGHQSMMLADMDTGIGVVVLINGPGYPWDIAEYILSVYRASHKGEPVPPIPSAARKEVVDDAQSYAGTYTGTDESFQVVENQQRLYLKRGSECLFLEPRGWEPIFYTNHPDSDRFLWRFERVAGEVAILNYGSAWYANERYAGPETFHFPDKWKAYCGAYEMYSPWDSCFRVLIRRDQLILVFPGNISYNSFECVLKPRSDGGFVVVDGDRNLDLVTFECDRNGEALIARFSGTPFYRRF